MQHRPHRGPLRALALAGLGAGAWLAFAGSAQGGPADDGVPTGTIAFFSGGACPAGWTTATDVQGRLVVAVADGTKTGISVGTPLGDQEDRTHQHAYTGSVTLGSHGVTGASGCCADNGAAAQSYTVMGSTDMAPTSLPFVQVQPCLKM